MHSITSVEGPLQMFYFPQTFALQRISCKLADPPPYCLCFSWAAADEALFQGSKILDKSWGKSDITRHSDKPQRHVNTQGTSQSSWSAFCLSSVFLSKYIDQCSLKTTKMGSAREAVPNVGRLEVSAILNANSGSLLHRSLCSITFQMMSSWCGIAFRNNFNISITGLALSMHTSSFSFTVIGTRHIFWILPLHWRKKLHTPF